jgi:prepilin-type N-terminal cleavage/methylation domain-containing protein
MKARNRPVARCDSANQAGLPARARRGISLIEVVVAMTLFAVVLTGVAALTTQVARSAQLSSAATQRSAALAVGLNQLEALPYDSLPSRQGCRNVASTSFARRECVTVTNVAPRVRRVQFTLTPVNTVLRPDTITFDRARPTPGNPLNLP